MHRLSRALQLLALQVTVVASLFLVMFAAFSVIQGPGVVRRIIGLLLVALGLVVGQYAVRRLAAFRRPA